MLELGEHAPTLHAACGKAAADAGHRSRGGRARQRATSRRRSLLSAESPPSFFPMPTTAGEWLAKNLQPGDVVLVKGSRGVQLERAIEILKTHITSIGEPVIRRNFPLLCALLSPCFLLSRSRRQIPADWTTPFPPFRIAGNLYYVGTEDLAAYLIVTPRGNILINSNLESSPAADQEEPSSRSASNSATPRSCSSAMATTTTAPAAPKSNA